MSIRLCLPNRRASEFFGFESMDMKFTASISRDADGNVAELFLDNHKAGSSIGTLVRDAAIILSFALQQGVDLAAVHKALGRDGRGSALSPIGTAPDLLADTSTNKEPNK
jgi:hypothetical protein